MRFERQLMQAFYIENQVVEYTLTYEEACNLMAALSIKLQYACVKNLDITLPFVTTPLYEESSIYENVLCKKVAVVLEVKTTDKEFTKFKRQDIERFDIVKDYFDV